MTPGARLAATAEVLDAWRAGLAAEQALARWARGARYAGSGDRAAVRDHVYDVLRRLGSCAAAGGHPDWPGEGSGAPGAGLPSGRALILGLVRLQGGDPEALFDGQGHAPAPLSAPEAAFQPPPPDPARDMQPWIVALLRERSGDDLGRLLAAFGQRAPLWLRVNLRRGPREAAAARLAAEGIATRAHPGVPTALEVLEGGRGLRGAGAYLDGLVEVQDLSVQQAMAAIDWPRAGRILDYCAGGGGKALALADLTQAAILAHDAEPRRMADLAPRAARAGVRIATVAGGDLRRVAGAGFEAVLLDVPCSGSGTWRRDPETRWRLTPARLEEVTRTQDAILAAGAGMVAAGGLLVYMTCSLLRVENEARIAAFLAGRAGWSRVAEGVATPLDASDGFYHCALRRD